MEEYFMKTLRKTLLVGREQVKVRFNQRRPRGRGRNRRSKQFPP